MTVPLSLFLFLYLLYLIIFVVFTIFNLWHILKFGFVSFWAYTITISYIALTVIALFVSYFYIARIDWSVPFEILGSSGGNASFFIGF